ncbi:MAG: SDR family NAD(P)-dependent oxidoreductase [Cyclobacteriaceae bacterium]|nr:SDR family NAD(P)-dependent oxidoreductase [Cyclobacteriaceae bacterium]
MARVFITGSADGLGQLSGQLLIKQGHNVVLHARDEARAKDALAKTPGAEAVVTGELSDIADTIALAKKVNDLGAFDAIIHNAGVYTAPAKQIFTINTVAPYVLTCLITKPKRLIYLSSGLHKQGTVNLNGLAQEHISYSDSKLYVLMLAKILARKWPAVYANAVDPGWVPTKMGGKNAPDNLQKGYETQAWLAVSEDEAVKVSGRYFFHQKEKPYNSLADDEVVQEKFLALMEKVTGVSMKG